MSSKDPNSSIQKLARKWQEGTITAEEKLLFNKWYDSFEDNLEEIDPADHDELKARLYKIITEREKIYTHPALTYKGWSRYAAVAALVFLFLSFGGYFYLRSTQPVQQLKAGSQTVDILPGENKAVLTLADGSEIILNGAKNGVLASQGNISIHKNKEGQIIYQAFGNGGRQQETIHNTISTPRGGQYQVDLPDGTKVWLNAASALTFPVTFNQKERRVKLSGEAYFEVNPVHSGNARSGKVPFIVESPGQEIKVLGTHFNVNAYPDERDTRTTLLEGSVKVTRLASHHSKLLTPGQQSVVDQTISVSDVDPAQAIAWQKGYFTFENESVESIMRKISRWYNVEVEYQGNIRERKFGGIISKFESISQILHTMQKTGVIHFKIEERRIIVMP